MIFQAEVANQTTERLFEKAFADDQQYRSRVMLDYRWHGLDEEPGLLQPGLQPPPNLLELPHLPLHQETGRFVVGYARLP